MTSRNPIYINSDNLLFVRGVQNTLTEEFINDATVELTLLDSAGVEIVGQTWPLVMTYQTASDGNYYGTVEDTINVEDGDEGTARLEITGDGLETTLELDVVFRLRGDPSLAWTSRKEMEYMFGIENLKQWADLENNQSAADISERIQWAVDEATAEARERLMDSPVNLASLTEVPRTLRVNTTRLAGVLLYESRGVKDTENEEGKHKLSYHQQRANKYFQQVIAGTIRIQGTNGATTIPGIVFDNGNNSVEDDIPTDDDECSCTLPT